MGQPGERRGGDEDRVGAPDPQQLHAGVRAVRSAQRPGTQRQPAPGGLVVAQRDLIARAAADVVAGVLGHPLDGGALEVGDGVRGWVVGGCHFRSPTKLRKLRREPVRITNTPQFVGIYPDEKFQRFPENDLV
jgi:hypothetical protein